MYGRWIVILIAGAIFAGSARAADDNTVDPARFAAAQKRLAERQKAKKEAAEKMDRATTQPTKVATPAQHDLLPVIEHAATAIRAELWIPSDRLTELQQVALSHQKRERIDKIIGGLSHTAGELSFVVADVSPDRGEGTATARGLVKLGAIQSVGIEFHGDAEAMATWTKGQKVTVTGEIDRAHYESALLERVRRRDRERGWPDALTFSLNQYIPPAKLSPTTAPQIADKSSKRVVFLLSARGAMLNQFADAKTEIGKGITALTPDQIFAIVVAHDSNAILSSPALVPATPANKESAWKFLSNISTTGTDGLDTGIKAAAKLRPDVVWIIANEECSDNKAFIALSRRLSAGRFRVNTTTKFVREGEDVSFFSDVAEATGGICIDGEGKEVVHKEKKISQPVLPSGPSIFHER